MEYSSIFKLFALLLMFLVSFLQLKRYWRKSKKEKLPPGPWRLPFIGSLRHLIMRGSLPHRTLAKLAKKYGPIMYLQLGEAPVIVISSPSLAKVVLRTQDDLAFATRPKLGSTKIISYNWKDIVFAPYGDYWKQMRKICVVVLLSAKMVKSFSSIPKDEISRLVSSIQSMNDGSVVNITQKVLHYTNSVICRSALGKVGKDQDKLINLMREVMELVGAFDVGDLFSSWKLLHNIIGTKSRLLKLHHRVDAAMEKELNDHIKNLALGSTGNGAFGGEDLVDVLLRIKQNGQLQFPLTNDHLKAVISEMFAAGTDTSAVTITWALAELMKNREIMAKAQREVRQSLKGNKNFDEADDDMLPYLNLVIKETLRLHPPSPFLPRECRIKTTIDGYTISPRTTVLVNAWALGRDPESWHDPESFIPERFENSDIGFMGNHFEFVPFGAGRRICPGIQFGLATVRLALAQLLYHFDWELPYETFPNDLDMTETSGLTAAKQQELCLIAKSNEMLDVVL